MQMSSTFTIKHSSGSAIEFRSIPFEDFRITEGEPVKKAAWCTFTDKDGATCVLLRCPFCGLQFALFKHAVDKSGGIGVATPCGCRGLVGVLEGWKEKVGQGKSENQLYLERRDVKTAECIRAEQDQEVQERT